MTAMKTNFINQLRFNENGLIPAIAQDWLDGAVLMVAWMNKASIELTIQTGEVHYWSRSRQELWHKGKTSGNRQILKGMRHDCDADVLLLSIKQIGSGACHTGARSCFFLDSLNDGNKVSTSLLPPTDTCTELFQVIQNRVSNPEEGSYTNKLLKGGDNMTLKKIGEESAEFVMACKDNDVNEISKEAADLIFHIQVALALHGVNWRDVLNVLATRRNAPRRQ
ncbi:bifunctional phosphoribosyl-AMP cyclohydrolase/phosphoribosyl-ATP diphosphatase HisIE [Prochlorococcus sp. MIT 1341]|uniref:bifunctional phosphoribosyl-AMP cyclohydrolase/phosphoribosyl-ATP diphosphatase HisIE n=1 Tax=Prochlorococcus sp. MIT 1341 TaxID=3096221 RepID=UPI002A7540CC|nr:bifunctional phosphoribosyl-AMP cyclohydrolase/phosphoribosyl-ATP diphosphatase HisIE [Prochlorococcus sp. MIT 1341]